MALDIEDEELEEGGSFSQDENDEGSEDKNNKSDSFNRDDFVADAFAEGIEESVIEELAEKEEVTLDDLRKIPGAEKLTDEELTAAWDKAQADAGIKAGADQKLELPFPVYDAQGNKIAADKLTLSDLFSGKVQIGYQAMGKEQRKAFSDLVRNASQGHWNEHRYNSVQSQYRQAVDKLTALEKEAGSFREMQSQWNSALTALLTGNQGPMKALIESYRTELTKAGQTPPSGFVAQDQVQAEREAADRGMQWWTEVGLPSAYDIASNYKADPKEVQGAIKWYIENEPNLTQERIDEIIKFDVPFLLEKNGYTSSGAVGQANNNNQPNNEVAELKKQIEALSAKLAGNANARTNNLRERSKKIPPAGSGAISGAGDSMPSFKSRDQMKEWLRQ